MSENQAEIRKKKMHCCIKQTSKKE